MAVSGSRTKHLRDFENYLDDHKDDIPPAVFQALENIYDQLNSDVEDLVDEIKEREEEKETLESKIEQLEAQLNE